MRRVAAIGHPAGHRRPMRKALATSSVRWWADLEQPTAAGVVADALSSSSIVEPFLIAELREPWSPHQLASLRRLAADHVPPEIRPQRSAGTGC